MADKEQIIIDGVAYYKQQDINKGLDEEHYITEFHLLATHYNLLLEDYARKTQKCDFWKRQAELGSETTDRLAKQLEEKEQECEALKSEAFTRESLITLQEDDLQLAEQLIAGILKTLNLEAYDWRADQNEILTEIRTFEVKYEALKLENEEGYEIVDELKQECESLNKRAASLEEIADDLQQRNHHLTQECKKLNNKIIDMNSIIEDAAINLGNKDFTLYDLPFEIKKLSQECDTLKSQLDFGVQQKEGFEQECEQKEKELKELKRQYKLSCLDCEYKNTKADVNRYRKALEEIKEVWAKDEDGDYDFVKWQILNIINKAKGEGNE